VPRGGGPGGVSGGPGWVWVWGWAASWAFSLQAVPVDGQRGRAHRSRSDQLSTLLPLAQGYCLSNLMLLLNLIEAWGCPSLFLSLCRLRATSPSQGSRFDFSDVCTADLQQRVHTNFIHCPRPAAARLHFRNQNRPRIFNALFSEKTRTRSLEARIHGGFHARAAYADELSQGNVDERNIQVFCCIWSVVADNLLVLLYVTKS